MEFNFIASHRLDHDGKLSPCRRLYVYTARFFFRSSVLLHGSVVPPAALGALEDALARYLPGADLGELVSHPTLECVAGYLSSLANGIGERLGHPLLVRTLAAVELTEDHVRAARYDSPYWVSPHPDDAEPEEG
jgi:hypothetical protein